MDKGSNFVSREKFNEVVYEIKQEIGAVDVKADRLYTELKNNNQHLKVSIDSLNKNIQAQTQMMSETMKEMKQISVDVDQINKENITRDHLLDDYGKFKEETSEKLSARFGETLKFLGVVLGVVGTVIAAIIQVAHNFF